MDSFLGQALTKSPRFVHFYPRHERQSRRAFVQRGSFAQLDTGSTLG